jgi:hypothetical protein
MNIILTIVVIAVHSMPAWMHVFANLLMSPKLRKYILIFLVVTATTYYFIVSTKFDPKLFSDVYLMFVVGFLLVFNWLITIHRAYQLWPRQKE